MATLAHTPHGRGYDWALNYFHHMNDYWVEHYVEGKDHAKSAMGRAATTCEGYGVLLLLLLPLPLPLVLLTLTLTFYSQVTTT